MPIFGSSRNLIQTLQNTFFSVRRVFEDPAQAHSTANMPEQLGQYNLLWAYYSASMFDRGMLNQVGQWASYKKQYNLYRNIRNIYNPTRRLVDFYADSIYPGALSEDGQDLPDGISLAIPLAQDTDLAIKTAVAQFWDWSNFGSLKRTIPLYGAALGSVMVELCDDPVDGEVYAIVQWPGYVTNLDLDQTGEVESYAIQYQVTENVSSPPGQIATGAQRYYTYRKEVDGQFIRTYKNGQPFDYKTGLVAGSGAATPNLYGFAPAVWIRHTDIGSTFGSPAIAGSLGKLDELNSLASHIHDQVHKVISAPIIIGADAGGISNLFANSKQKRPSSSEFDTMTSAEAESEEILMLKGPADVKVQSLAGNLALGDALVYVNNLLAEIESDHPELAFYRELRSMSQLTGPAASRVIGDVTTKVMGTQSNYDRALIRLFQMALAIGGERANRGDWGLALNPQQAKFLPFSLKSYRAGELDISIMPRPLLTPTRQELALEHQAEAQAVATYKGAGVPLETALIKVAGWTEDEISEMKTLQEENQAEALENAQKMAAVMPQPAPDNNQNNQPQPATNPTAGPAE